MECQKLHHAYWDTIVSDLSAGWEVVSETFPKIALELDMELHAVLIPDSRSGIVLCKRRAYYVCVFPHYVSR